MKKEKHLHLQVLILWCGRWDLNPYVIQHTPLKRACLPIPALPRIQLMHLRCNSDIIFNKAVIVNTKFENSFFLRMKENVCALRLLCRGTFPARERQRLIHKKALQAALK